MGRIIEALNACGEIDTFMTIGDIGGPEEISVAMFINNLEIVPIEAKKTGGAYSYRDIYDYAKKIGAPFGLQHAECFMRAQWKIPEDWKKYDILFPMTALQRKDIVDGKLYIPVLCWDAYHGWELILWPWFPIWNLGKSRLIRWRREYFSSN